MKLSISESTVRNHLHNILEKLHLHNRVQAAIYALEMGFGAEQQGAEGILASAGATVDGGK